MKNEVKRALFKKSNMIIIIAVISLMFVNAYHSGWKTALTASNAKDIANAEDILFFQKYFGNVYRVWKSSYIMVQALAPLILVAPYLITYLDEKMNHFRYFSVSRKGILKYNVHKIIAIALSGTIVLASAELLFGFISYFLTQHDESTEFLKEIVSFKESFFLSQPLLYFTLVYLSHIIYYFSFLLFAIGITSFFKNKIAVIIMPFVVIGLLDMLLPAFLQPNVMMQPYNTPFSFIGYGILMVIYMMIGFVLLGLSEKNYLQKGS